MLLSPLESLSSSSFSPWYFSSFLYFFFLMLLSLGTATSVTTASFLCCLLWQCLVGWPVLSCLSKSGSPTGALPCYFPQPSEEFPTWTWEGLVYTRNTCSCTWYQPVGCAVQCMLFLPAFCILPLRVGLSLKPLCAVCTWDPVWCGRPLLLSIWCLVPVLVLLGSVPQCCLSVLFIPATGRIS